MFLICKVNQQQTSQAFELKKNPQKQKQNKTTPTTKKDTCKVKSAYSIPYWKHSSIVTHILWTLYMQLSNTNDSKHAI